MKFSRVFADYPSSDWTLEYSFRGPSKLDDQQAIASGSGYMIMIDANDTECLKAGNYSWAARVSNSTETHTVARGVLEVVPVVQAVVVSHNQKMLDAINAALEGRVVADMAQYTIGGRSVTKLDFKQLLNAKGAYESRVDRDKHPGRLGVPVKVSFTPVNGPGDMADPVALPPWYAGAR